MGQNAHENKDGIKNYKTAKYWQHWSRFFQVPRVTTSRNRTLKEKIESDQRMVADFHLITDKTNLSRLKRGNIYSFLYLKHTCIHLTGVALFHFFKIMITWMLQFSFICISGTTLISTDLIIHPWMWRAYPA